jgi:hypothetical protein
VLVPLPHSDTPFSAVHLDFGEFKKKEGVSTTKSFLVAVDEATRFMFSWMCRQSAKDVILSLQSTPEFSSLTKLITDNGRCFVSSELQDWMKNRNIRLIHTTPYHPAGNGLVERRMRDIKTFVTICSNGTWRERLALAVDHFNKSYHSSLGCSPFFFKYRFAPKLPADDFLGIAHTPLDEVPFTSQEQQRNVDRMKRNYDLKHAGSSPFFQVGDHIFVRKGEGHLSKMFGPVSHTCPSLQWCG